MLASFLSLIKNRKFLVIGFTFMKISSFCFKTPNPNETHFPLYFAAMLRYDQWLALNQTNHTQ